VTFRASAAPVCHSERAQLHGHSERAQRVEESRLSRSKGIAPRTVPLHSRLQEYDCGVGIQAFVATRPLLGPPQPPRLRVMLPFNSKEQQHFTRSSRRDAEARRTTLLAEVPGAAHRSSPRTTPKAKTLGSASSRSRRRGRSKSSARSSYEPARLRASHSRTRAPAHSTPARPYRHTYVATAPIASECVTRRPANATSNVSAIFPSFITTTT
jgi:hypothetical protein